MADGILGLGSGQAATLNQDLIDKLKSAERKASVEPIETDIADIELESVSLEEIKLYATDLLDSIKPFDLYVTNGVNAFEAKTANTTGDSVVFDAVDAASLNTGTTSVTITQLAQKDAYQSDIISDPEAVVSTTIGSKLTINGVDFSTYNKTYEDLASDINNSSKFNSSVELVGTDTYRLVIKSEESGTDNALEITETGIDLGLNEQSSSDSIYQLEADSDSFITSSSGGTVLIGGTSIILSVDGADTTISIASGSTLSSLVSDINSLANFSASIDGDGHITITHSSGSPVSIDNNDSGLDFTRTLTDDLSITIDGTTFTTNGETADEFIARIDASSSFKASVDINGIVSITRVDGTALEITNDDLDLGFSNDNHTLSAQNLQAVVDGISYDVSSNTITVDGGLKITAVSTGNSTISIEKDTTQIETLFTDFIDKFNIIMDKINTELYSSDSNIADKSTLRNIQSQMKEFMFKNYGVDSNLSLFNYGLSTDIDGKILIDSTIFNKAVAEDFDNLKNLIIGVAEAEGFGTQFKEYVDNLDGYEGLLTTYEEGMTTRKTNLESDLEKAEEDLDNKYSLLAEQFAEYSAIITRFDAQFASLKMMIEQSVAG